MPFTCWFSYCFMDEQFSSQDSYQLLEVLVCRKNSNNNNNNNNDKRLSNSYPVVKSKPGSLTENVVTMHMGN